MKDIKIGNEDRLLTIINKILTTQESEVKVEIANNSVLFRNKLNLKLFQRILDSSGKVYKIETDNLKGKEMLAQVRESDQDEADFSKYQEIIKEGSSEEGKVLETTNSQKFEFPKLSLPKLSIPNLKMLPAILGAVFLVLGLGYYFLVYRLTVDLEVLVSSERFVKSFEIKLSSIQNTDVDNKVIRAESVSTVFQATKEISTTGKVEGGKKAEGELKFLNKTDKSIKLSKDTKITYKDSGKEYIYLLDSSIEIPERSLTSTEPETFVSGEKIESATASNFGSSYNLSAGKTLSVAGYSTSELSAVVSSSFEGGVKNTLNAVSEEDIKNISQASFDEFKTSFVFSTNSSSKVILKNSESFSVASEKFNFELSDPTDKLAVTQDIVVSYIMYDSDQVMSFVKSSIKSLIPDGFELYGKDLQLELNSLGSTSGVSYNNKEADVQLTVKSYKIPTLDEEEIKQNVSGKSISEVSGYLDSLDLNYNISSTSGLINVLGFPKDIDKINVTITKQ